MTDIFKIYLDRLKNGNAHKIHEAVDPIFMDVDEAELVFEDPVQIKGEAYIAEEDLIIHLTASTKGKMPCSVCNEMTSFSLGVSDYYHTQPLSEIKGLIFDFSIPLREALLLELPKTVECNGKCPKRDELSKYLKKEKPKPTDDTYFPFSNMDL